MISPRENENIVLAFVPIVKAITVFVVALNVRMMLETVINFAVESDGGGAIKIGIFITPVGSERESLPI
jgi:hypothetical protein